MLLKQFVSSIIFFACLLFLTNSVRADVLDETDGTLFGKITQITETDFFFAKGCNQSNIKKIPKSRVRFYQYDSSCEPHSFTLPTSPFQLCEQEKQKIFKITFNHEENEIFALDVRLRKNGTVFIILPGTLGTIQGSIQKIKSIVPAQICLKAIPEDFRIPKEFCHESFKMAVNFNLEPVSKNQIFTKAFPFYFEIVGNGEPEFKPEDVMRAFGAALTGWSSTLLALRSELKPPLAEYLNSIVRTTASGNIMLIPPQVIQVDCKENALVIVKLYKERDHRLFPQNSGYVAKAQLEGRTILLNGLDFQYRAELDTRMLIKDNKINLTTVFAHELGHSFGLPDIDNRTLAVSIMNVESIEKNLAGRPTKEDGTAFVTILEKAVTGARPGDFNPTECAGFRLSTHRRK